MEDRNRTAGVNRAVMKGLVAYLIFAWLLVQFVPEAAHLRIVAWSVLLGFPTVMIIARLLYRHGMRAAAGGWAVATIAGLAAISVPLACLYMPATQDRIAQADSDLLEILPAALIDNAEVDRGDEQLRLRIRGLTAVGGTGLASGSEAVELIIYTSLRREAELETLVIEAELVTSEDDAVIWHHEYLADPSDYRAIRQLLIRALTDGMRLTQEGADEGLIV